MNVNAKIYIAGHRGLVGSAIYRSLQSAGCTNLITRSHQTLDLEHQAEVEAFFQSERPEYVFLAAAKVGGIWANATYPADFIHSNLAIQTNVIHASSKTEVKRLIFLGSSCIYPRECPQPMREEYLLTGPLETTNRPYAVAKIAGVIQCESYNRQYGTRFLAVMPTNLFGPNDNFELETSHVLPALIRKFHLAKLAAKGHWDLIERDEAHFGTIPTDFLACLNVISESKGHRAPRPTPYSFPHNPTIILWGTGSPRREFLHVDELANACLFLMNLPDRTFGRLCSGSNASPELSARSRESSARTSASDLERSGPQAERSSIGALPLVNIGSGQDQTIKELAAVVAEVVGYDGEIAWDVTKPDGTPRKLLDISRIKGLGWSPKIDLKTDIRSTYEWFLSQIE
jgi:GDP-L-fucose synthase